MTLCPSVYVTPFSRVLLRLIVVKLIHISPTFYGTRIFINMFTRVVSYVGPVHITHYFCDINCNIVLPPAPTGFFFRNSR
jgi:hypothetical protein